MLEKPRFIEEGWQFFDEQSNAWKLKPDAPEWAKKEFDEFYALVNPKPDENGIVKVR